MPPEVLFAVLIAPAGANLLTQTHIDHATSALPQTSSWRWLGPGEAAEISFCAAIDDRARLIGRLHEVLGPTLLDICIVPARSRRKRLLVADMDSTIIAQECIDELAALAGVRTEVAAITERSMRGELDFAQSLQARVRLLQGLTQADLERVAATRLTLNPGARALTATMRRQGALTAIVSGGFATFTSHVRALAGFDRDLSNQLEIVDGRLTGELIRPILGREAKRQALLELSAELDIGLDQTLAVGDGANDIEMIRTAGLGVAFRAKPVLADAADAHIEHGDLTALLYLQGFSADEIISAASSERD